MKKIVTAVAIVVFIAAIFVFFQILQRKGCTGCEL